VASAFEWCTEEFPHNHVGFFGTDESPWHDKHIGIIVLACQMGYFCCPAEGCADTLMLVQRYTDAFTASADGNTRIALSGFNGQSQRMRKVGIVATLG